MVQKSALTGSRIRERRIDLGLKQAHLADLCQISASYLNLIEHNRRSIGGKLLNRLSDALGVSAQSLSEGADATLLDSLRDAASGNPALNPEIQRLEEFAGRFPGWAALLSSQTERIGALERTVEMLNDRLTHDPLLSASLHDILSTVTAIRSSSAILDSDEDIEPEWRARFSRNIHEDSQRLTDAAENLVEYLDTEGATDQNVVAPHEEVEFWLSARDYDIPEIESGNDTTVDQIVADAFGTSSASARAVASRFLHRMKSDAAILPAEDLRKAVAEFGHDPVLLHAKLGIPLVVLLRRLATVPFEDGRTDYGLVICDSSGTLTFRKGIEGFAPPRFGAACPLLPLFQALLRPLHPIISRFTPAGRDARTFAAYAIAEPSAVPGFGEPPVFESTMLYHPDSGPDRLGGSVVEIGSSCRICARPDCPVRREPSILGVVA